MAHSSASSVAQKAPGFMKVSVPEKKGEEIIAEDTWYQLVSYTHMNTHINTHMESERERERYNRL